MNDHEHEPAHELVMPFLPVTSKGGPFDDDSFVAGYEMGLLDAELRSVTTYGAVHRTLRADNQAQADLLAMRHGWRSEFVDVGDGWVGASFTRIETGDPTR